MSDKPRKSTTPAAGKPARSPSSGAPRKAPRGNAAARKGGDGSAAKTAAKTAAKATGRTGGVFRSAAAAVEPRSAAPRPARPAAGATVAGGRAGDADAARQARLASTFRGEWARLGAALADAATGPLARGASAREADRLVDAAVAAARRERRAGHGRAD